MPRTKLPDPGLPCEVHWSRSYAPNADNPPGSKCGRWGYWTVVIPLPGAKPAIVPTCTTHVRKLADEMQRRGVRAVVWRRLKRSCQLCWTV